LTKTDDILSELNKSVANHIKGVCPFQYKKKTYRLVDNYVAVPYMKCDVCGDYPTYEVSVIESQDGKTLRVGNDCIDRLTGENISEYFKTFRIRRENAIENRKSIDR